MMCSVKGTGAPSRNGRRAAFEDVHAFSRRRSAVRRPRPIETIAARRNDIPHPIPDGLAGLRQLPSSSRRAASEHVERCVAYPPRTAASADAARSCPGAISNAISLPCIWSSVTPFMRSSKSEGIGAPSPSIRRAQITLAAGFARAFLDMVEHAENAGARDAAGEFDRRAFR